MAEDGRDESSGHHRIAMAMDLSSGLIVAGLMAVGAAVAGAIIVHELRVMRTYRRRLVAAVGGEPADSGPIRVHHGPRQGQLRILQSRRGPPVIELLLPASVPNELALHRRDLMDRTAARMGLIQPIPTGDADLDRRLVMLGADPAAGAAAVADPQVRAGLKRLLDARMTSFIWSADDQAVVVRWTSDHDAGNDAALAAQALMLAAAVSRAPTEPRSGTPRTQAHDHGDAVIGAVLLGVCGIGLGGFAAMALDATYPPFDRGPLLAGATAVAGLVTPVVGWWAWRRPGRRLADHRAWLPMVAVMAPGSWLVAYAALVALNASR